MMQKLENWLLPLANKLSQNKYLTAIRNGFIAIMPLMIIGSFFILINNVIIGPNGFLNKWFGLELLKLTELGAAIAPATMSIMGLLLTFTTAKALCEEYKEETTLTPIIAVVNLVVLMPVAFENGIEFINTYYTGAAGMIMAFIVAIVTVEVLRRLSKVNAITIKMPESVPTAVARSFNKLIPIMITILIFGVIRMITNSFDTYLHDLIFKFIQIPFRGIVSSPLGLVVIYFVYMLLWGLGIHSAFIFNPILEPLYLDNLTINQAAVQAGMPMTEIITKPFLDSVAFIGGAGNMLALIVAILIVSKRKEYRTIAKLGLAPAIFNISEPIMFGLPVVMNPIFIIPMIATTLAGLGIGALATSIGFMGYTYNLIPWVTPIGFNAWLSTGFNVGAVITVIIIFVVSVLIYMPFVMVANKQQALKNEGVEK